MAGGERVRDNIARRAGGQGHSLRRTELCFEAESESSCKHNGELLEAHLRVNDATAPHNVLPTSSVRNIRHTGNHLIKSGS